MARAIFTYIPWRHFQHSTFGIDISPPPSTSRLRNFIFTVCLESFSFPLFLMFSPDSSQDLLPRFLVVGGSIHFHDFIDHITWKLPKSIAASPVLLSDQGPGPYSNYLLTSAHVSPTFILSSTFPKPSSWCRSPIYFSFFAFGLKGATLAVILDI